MSQHNAKWGIDIKRLRFGRTRGRPCSGITAMCDTHVAGKATHVAGTEDVTHQALVFVHMKRTSISGHNAGSILATMLQNG